MARVFAVLVHSRKERSTAWFLPSGYKASLTLRVSRYKASRKQVTSHGVVILLTVLARSGFITGYKSVMAAGLEAKTMTSLLILPALLVKVQFFFHHAGSVIRVQFSFFYCL